MTRGASVTGMHVREKNVYTSKFVSMKLRFPVGLWGVDKWWTERGIIRTGRHGYDSETPCGAGCLYSLRLQHSPITQEGR